MSGNEGSKINYDGMNTNVFYGYDRHWAYVQLMTLPAGRFVGERSYPEVKDLPNYHDVVPRVGVAYDVFGNGRTAIKGSWGKYLAGLGGGDARNAARVRPAEGR